MGVVALTVQSQDGLEMYCDHLDFSFNLHKMPRYGSQTCEKVFY